MFNVGGPEIVVILLVALVILGPEQLPKAMRTFGNVMAEIRKVSGGFQDEMRKAMDSIDDSGSKKASAASSDGGTTLAQTPEEADVTEIVARNTSEPTEMVPSVDAAAETTEVADDRFPRIDPADRAAG